MRLVLDTCTVRNYIQPKKVSPENIPNISGLGSYVPHILVSIADTAFLELICQLLNGGIPFDDWAQRIHEIDTVLEPSLPIFPGGNELAVMSGIIQNIKFNIEDTKIFQQTAWRFIRDARSKDDILKKELIFADSKGVQSLSFMGETFTKLLMDNAHMNWSDNIEKIYSKLDQFAPGISLKPLISGTLANLPAEIPIKLKPVVMALCQYVYLYGQGYNPSSDKRKGDIFDWTLLFALPLPAIICTVDQPLVNRLRQIDASEFRAIIKVEELNIHLANGTLHQILPSQ